MIKFLKNIVFWVYLKYHTVMYAISVALYNTEENILKADPNNLKEKDKYSQRKRHRNPLLEKFYAGVRDDKYIQQYYEILKKSDKFIRTATPEKMEIAAWKYGTSYGMKDKYGRRYEHYGFFDSKHKNAGKTLAEVMDVEIEERRTKDDDFKLIQIFDNKPIEVGFVKVLDVVEKTENENADFEYEVLDIFRKSKQFEFPIKVGRNFEECDNKIEQLTEFLHVKYIGFEYRQLEFFIPLKFKTSELTEDSEIFKDIVNINTIFVKDEYGKLIGFGSIKFKKRITHNDAYDVLKFDAVEMEIMGSI